ncbi:MAG: S8 family peptidase [Candidatus Binatia bacterium]
MAKRKKNSHPKPSSQPKASPKNAKPPVVPDRELVITLDPTAEQASRAAARVRAAAPSDVNQVLEAYGASIRPLFGRAGTGVAARVSTAPADSELGQYFKVEAADDQLDELAEQLRQQPGVTAAYIKPPAEPPVLNDMLPRSAEAAPLTVDFSSRQGYLQAAPAGIDAPFAWAMSGGKGDGVRVIDIEGAWLFTHEDLVGNQGGIVGGTPSADIAWRNHGTAVIGEIGGDENAFGITGIAPNANQRAISIFGGVGSAQAIKDAADLLSAGDIILIELHRAGPRHNFQARLDQRGYIAIEWWPDDFDAIRYAISRGVIVVEAAGNGAEDLDDAIYQNPAPGFPSNWSNPLRRSNRDSGAIVVGAGAPPPGTHGRNHGPDRSRLDFSNYGALIDAQAWGREVTTTGYGDLQGGDEKQWYTDQFSGTSSASPIVVGVLTCMQGVLRAQGRRLLTAATARSLLRSTGSPQLDAPGRPATQRIGNRPNLRQMIQQAAPTPSRPRLRLVQLICDQTEDWAGGDETYLQVNGQRVWGPMSMNNGQTADLRILTPIPFRQRARVDLYDQDAGWADRDDHLGATYAWSTELGRGEREHRFTGDGAQYTLVYEVL